MHIVHPFNPSNPNDPSGPMHVALPLRRLLLLLPPLLLPIMMVVMVVVLVLVVVVVMIGLVGGRWGVGVFGCGSKTTDQLLLCHARTSRSASPSGRPSRYGGWPR